MNLHFTMNFVIFIQRGIVLILKFFDVDMYYSVTNLIFLQGAEFSGE